MYEILFYLMAFILIVCFISKNVLQRVVFDKHRVCVCVCARLRQIKYNTVNSTVRLIKCGHIHIILCFLLPFMDQLSINFILFMCVCIAILPTCILFHFKINRCAIIFEVCYSSSSFHKVVSHMRVRVRACAQNKAPYMGFFLLFSPDISFID